MDGARLEVAQGDSGEFAEGGGGELIALPCPEEQESSGFEIGGGVDESGFQRFTGQLATFVETAEESAGELIEFGSTTLWAVVVVEDVSDEGFRF